MDGIGRVESGTETEKTSVTCFRGRCSDNNTKPVDIVLSHYHFMYDFSKFDTNPSGNTDLPQLT